MFVCRPLTSDETYLQPQISPHLLTREKNWYTTGFWKCNPARSSRNFFSRFWQNGDFNVIPVPQHQTVLPVNTSVLEINRAFSNRLSWVDTACCFRANRPLPPRGRSLHKTSAIDKIPPHGYCTTFFCNKLS